ncbi:MAG: zinc ribbon domain-containing protein [Pseudomonadota bacterium]
MPTYDYFCDANDQKVEVKHRMSEELKNWGELCDKAGIETGDTPMDTPVRRLISGGAFISSSSLSNPEPVCGAGGCCPGGACGLTD